MWVVGREGGSGALARDNPLSDRSVAGSELTNDLPSHLINNTSQVPPSAPQAEESETTQAGLDIINS